MRAVRGFADQDDPGAADGLDEGMKAVWRRVEEGAVAPDRLDNTVIIHGCF